MKRKGTNRPGTGSAGRNAELAARGTHGRVQRALRILLWSSGLVLFLVVAGALANFLERSSLFVLDQITIQGCERTRPEMIRSRSGVRKGLNLVALDSGRIARKLEACPPVWSAAVVKRFPRSLLIRIQEREPAVLVKIRDEMYYMDEQGVVFSRVSPGDLMDLPVITGLEDYPWPLGRPAEGRKVHAALSLLKTLHRRDLLGRLSEIHVDPSKGLSFYLEAFPVQIRIGWERFRERMTRLERILPLLTERQRGILSVDLRFDHQVVTRQTDKKEQRITRVERKAPFRDREGTNREETGNRKGFRDV